MKKINILFALIAMASCTVEPIEEPVIPELSVNGEEFIVHADLGGGTRTEIQPDGKVYWSPGEQIIVHNMYDKAVFTATNTEPAPSADFKGILPEAIQSSTKYYWVYYPVSDDNEGPENWTYRTSGLSGFVGHIGYLPDEQVGKADGLGPKQDMGAAYVHYLKLKDVHFNHLIGGLRFSVKEPGITKITIKSHGGEGIAGAINPFTGTAVDSQEINGELVGIYEITPAITETGYSQIVLTPEEGTFVPGANYFIAMRPVTLETGFSLYVEKGDDWGTRLDINKRVEIRVSEFRTLQECDKDFDWDNTVLTFSKDQFYLGPYSGGFSTKVVCPGPYTIDQIGCDWLQEVDATDWDQPIYPGWAYMITSPEEPGGDARFDGCNHVFALKANYGPERSTTVTFRHKGQAYPITVTQGAGDWLPNIKRTHFGCVFHTMDENMWDWKTDKALSGYLYNKHGDINHADGARLEYVQGAYGNTGSEFPAFVAGQYLWAQNLAIGDNPQFGTLAGDVNLNNYVYDYTNDVEPELYSDSFVPIMEKAMDEIDEYYIPTTTIAVTANECKEDTREIDVTVEVFAAKAGTYRLTGLIVERQVTYIPGGLLFAVSPSNHIIGYVTDYRGEEITFESDNSTKTVTLHAEVVPECTVPSDWHAPMVAAGYGRWSYLWMVFFTAEQFGTQVQFRMKPDGPNDYYVDNCLYVKFNTTYDHDGGSHEQASVDPGFDPNYPGWSNEDQW